MIYRLLQTENSVPLFAGWQETMIWSCQQGVMGTIYADALEKPASAMALLGDFCFFAGKPGKELVLYESGRSGREFVIMVPQNEEWAKLIEVCYGEHAKKVIRYAIKKEPDIFDQKALKDMVSKLPDGYILMLMDESLFRKCKEIKWCRDWVSQYDTFDKYQKHGLGAVIMKDGEIISGASSYSGYRGGIEVQIDTREDFRRKGLASICGAKLLLECLKRGWYPSWDAQNRQSVALAEKLGYHFEKEYIAYEVSLKQLRE